MLEVLKRYGVNIVNQELLMQALTHSSYSNEHDVNDYERLEFLGDTVLQLLISEYLYENTDNSEGDMSKVRASFVCEQALAFYSKKLRVNEYVLVGKGQENNISDAIIADVFESILGTIYLDQGLLVAKDFVYKIVIPYIKKDFHFFGDYKSMLQELVQTDKKSVEYVLIQETGPAHDKKFEIEVRINGLTFGKGVGKNKKQAEQYAALDAINKQASF